MEVLIATADAAVAQVADRLAHDLIPTWVAETGPDALHILEGAPRLVVLDSELEAEAAFKLYRILHDMEPRPALLLLTAAGYSPFALDSGRPTMDDYAVKPIGPDELLLRIKAALLRAGFALPVPPPMDSAPPPIVGGRSGEIISVFSTRGGVGKTTLAVNLAVGLAQRGRSTLLVDADLWFGDAAVMLNLAPESGMREVCAAEELDYAVLQRALTRHESGLAVLTRPKEAAVVDQLDPATILRALQRYTTLFDYLIVDMRAAFDEVNLQLLDAAHQILLVITPEIGASHTTASFIHMSEALQYTTKLRLVLNRADSGLDREALERTFGLGMAVAIPSAGRVMVQATNQGVPVLMAESVAHAELTRSLGRVVELVMGQGAPPPRPVGARDGSRGGALGRWMRGLVRSWSSN
ncbi:MAG: pilus assembly protein CpaE [Chloroflexota bacterium]|nr:pilus assembly protein CpaE [Chloroflexota bacterium]